MCMGLLSSIEDYADSYWRTLADISGVIGVSERFGDLQ